MPTLEPTIPSGLQLHFELQRLAGICCGRWTPPHPRAHRRRAHRDTHQEPYARHSRRLIDNTDVLASLRSDHDAAEPLITMLWQA